MFNYFLHSEFLVHASYKELNDCMVELNNVQINHKDNYDHFYKESNINNVIHDGGETVIKALFDSAGSNQFRYQILPQILQKLLSVEMVDRDINVLNRAFPSHKNSYWGAKFDEKQIYHLSCVEDYLRFRSHCKNEVCYSDFWMMKHFMFPHLDFCQQTKKQMQAIRNANDFSGVVTSLHQLDDYACGWSKGGFNMELLSRTVDASYESAPTLQQFGKERTFKINDEIGKKLCSPHIKVAKLRIHFYPEENTHKIYVAYIGPHLPTAKFR